jgi:hypothetical protein
MAERDLTGGERIHRREKRRLRVLFIGGTVVAALGDLALASGDFRRGATSLAVGLAGVLLGVKRAQWLTTAAGETTNAYTSWYTAAVGLVLMGTGAALTVPAREAETATAEVIGFLAAGVGLWLGVTCLIAAVVKGRRGNEPSPPPKGQRRTKPAPSSKGQRPKKPSPSPKRRRGRSG